VLLEKVELRLLGRLLLLLRRDSKQARSKQQADKDRFLESNHLVGTVVATSVRLFEQLPYSQLVLSPPVRQLADDATFSDLLRSRQTIEDYASLHRAIVEIAKRVTERMPNVQSA